MFKPCFKTVLSGLAVFVLCSNTSFAAPTTYNFSASGMPGAFSSVTGSFTVDGASVTAIDFSLGAHTYSASEVEFNSLSGTEIFGGKPAGAFFLDLWAHDFNLMFDAETLKFISFGYSLSNGSGVGTQTGTITKPTVPTPTTGLLIGIAALATFGVRRNRSIRTT